MSWRAGVGGRKGCQDGVTAIVTARPDIPVTQRAVSPTGHTEAETGADLAARGLCGLQVAGAPWPCRSQPDSLIVSIYAFAYHRNCDY